MPRLVAAIVASCLLAAAPARAEVRVVDDLRLADYAERGAIGVYALERGNPFTARLQFLLALEPLPSFLEVLDGPAMQVPGRPESTIPAIRQGRGTRGPPTIYVEEPRSGDWPTGSRYPVAVVGRGFRGVLTSDSTRLRGLVRLDDVVAGTLDWRADDDALETVERLDRRIERNDDLRLPLTLLVAAATIGLAFLRPRLAPRAVLLALALNLWLSPALALAAALAAVALPLGAACAAVVAVYLAALGLDAETVALSPLGPSQVSRFYGLSNLLATLLLLPALFGAARLGKTAGVLLALTALVAVGGSRFGADGGGLLVLLAGYGVLAVRLAGDRLTRRNVAVLGLAVVLGGLALVGLDALGGGSSHVTEAVGDGPTELARDLGGRVERSVERTLDSAGALAVVALGLAVLARLALRHRGDPVLDAVLVALAVSLVVNDTPSDVVGAGAAVALTLARLTVATDAASAP